MSITGFAYQGSLAEYLAIAVLLFHIVIASFHTVWMTFIRETSHGWDSMLEILVLAQNSQPSVSILKNISVGIDRLKTYSRRAKIRATQPAGHDNFDHIEMIFSQEDHENSMDGHEQTGTAGNELSDLPAKDDHVQAHISRQPPDDLNLNHQHQYSSTWPRSSAVCDNLSITISTSSLPVQRYGAERQRNRRTSAWPLDNSMVVKNDCEYG